MWYRKKSFWQPFWVHMAVGVVLSVLCAFSSLGLMASAAWLIASAAYQPGIHALSLAIIGVRVCGILRAVLRYAERYVTHDVTFRILGHIRNISYEGLERLLPLRDNRWSDEAVTGIFIREIEILKEFYLRLLLPFFTAAAVCLVMFIIWMFYVPAVAGLLLLLFAMIVLFIPVIVRRKNRCQIQLATAAEQAVRSIYLDLLYGMGELLTSDRIEERFSGLRKAAEASRHSKVAAFRRDASAQALAEVSGGIAVLAAFVLLVLLMQEGRVDGIALTVIVLSFQGLMEFFMPLSVLPQAYATARAAANCISPWLDMPSAKVEAGTVDKIEPDKKKPLLQAENISFVYDDGVLVLNNINFCLRQGEKVAVVGASGSGKSTLCCLLLRLYRHTQGTLRLGGTSYDDIAPTYIRAQFGAVMQEMHLFDGSVREFFDRLHPQAAEHELWSALEQAGLAKYIQSQPKGLDMLIGRHGGKLSGGQRRRLMLASALLEKRPILLLDEPGRGLDAHAGAALRRKIFSLPNSQALLLITHDFTGLQAIDRIIVLNQGGIVESGTYQELIEKKGLFFQMQCDCH